MKTILSWILAIVAVLFIKVHIFDISYVPSSSMEPNIHRGDFILINKLVDISNNFQKGRIYTFRYTQGSNIYIKRLIGMPGDLIRYDGMKIYINDNLIPVHYEGKDLLLENNYLIKKNSKDYVSYETHTPDNFYYFLGDNRDKSMDSRVSGFVPEENIYGEAVVVLFNLELPFFSEMKDFKINFKRIGYPLY